MSKRLRRFIFVDDAHSYVFKVFKSFLLYMYLLYPYRGQVQLPVSTVAENNNRMLVHSLNIAPKILKYLAIMFCKLIAGVRQIIINYFVCVLCLSVCVCNV